MNDPMKMALKELLDKMHQTIDGDGKDGHGMEVEINLGKDDDEKEKLDGDKAPMLDTPYGDDAPPPAAAGGLKGPPAMGGDDSQHMDILKSIADRSGAGGDMSLGARAASGAKAKLASMKK